MIADERRQTPVLVLPALYLSYAKKNSAPRAFSSVFNKGPIYITRKKWSEQYYFSRAILANGRKKTAIVERESRNARGKCRRLIKDARAVCVTR